MKDILLEKVFEAERWEAAINKGFFKGIDKESCVNFVVQRQE